MSYHLHWRRAVILSVICHIFFILGAGYLSAHIPATPASVESYVELELMDTPQAENAKDQVSSNAPISVTQPSQSPLRPVINQQASPSNTFTPTANVIIAVNTEGLTITSVSGNGTTPLTTEGNGSGSKETAIKGKGSDIISPSILSKIDPTYPPSARLAGIEGTTILKIQLHENGHLGTITVFRSSGNDELDTAAITAVKQWRFIPAKNRDSGQPIACYTTMPIAFHLK